MMIKAWKDLMIRGLDEDNVSFDWTARSITALHEKTKQAKATLIAKSPGIWAGDDALRALEVISIENGSPVEVKLFKKNGEKLASKDRIAALHGASDAILGFERTLINLTAYASGIATQTGELVDIVRAKKMKKPTRITCIRKTLPGYKAVAVESTLIGGAHPHRYNLSGGLLLKENHVAVHGSVAKAINAAREVSPHLFKVEIEVRDIAELREAIAGGAEVILLDNFTPDQIREAISLKPAAGVIYEVSGGINASNLSNYLFEGVDVISVGSITHSVKAVDLSLLMDSLL
ncbi:MAG: carboxylating nicotinate-nucleotide diphosphorylase [Bdellovibrionales bacterium]|nr:carboxylating nicotinate-nucleotide diphosphorylase [Bdellovibrionales bacterium]